MPSLFAAADAKSSAAVSRFMGERVQLIPWKDETDYDAGEPDETREAVEFQTVLSGALGSQNLGGDKRGSEFRNDMTTRDRALSTDVAEWPTYARAGDRIKALEQPGVPWFVISEDPHGDGANRVIAPLVKGTAHVPG